MRLNFFPLIDALLAAKLESKIWNIQSAYFSIKDIEKEGRVIVMKLGHSLKPESKALSNISAFIETFIKKRKRIALYYGDNYISKQNIIGIVYSKLLQNSSIIISHSSYLLAVAKDINRGAKVVQIPDPCLLSRYPFEFSEPESVCRIIWFGQGASKSYLLLNLPHLVEECTASKEYELSILARGDDLTRKIIPEVKNIILRSKTRPTKTVWKFRFVAWDQQDQPSQLERELRRAHISFIPSDPNNPWKAGASSNRLTDSLQAGCIAVSSQLQSYMELQHLSLQGEDFPHLIDVAWKNRTNLANKYSQAREKCLERYSASNVMGLWIKAISWL